MGVLANVVFFAGCMLVLYIAAQVLGPHKRDDEWRVFDVAPKPRRPSATIADDVCGGCGVVRVDHDYCRNCGNCDPMPR